MESCRGSFIKKPPSRPSFDITISSRLDKSFQPRVSTRASLYELIGKFAREMVRGPWSESNSTTQHVQRVEIERATLPGKWLII